MCQGEDGNAFDALSSTLDGSTTTDKNAWSYKSALALLSSNDNAGVGAEVERTSVASIIAAARSNLRRGREGEEEDDKVDQVKGEDGSESSSSDSDDDDEGGASDDDGSDSTSSSDDEVDDADKATHAMESDVLKVQERPQRTNKGKKEATVAVVESPLNNESDDKKDESDQVSEEEEEEAEQEEDDSEDERKEASKAAAFFDSSRVATTQDSTIDTFSQLGLSRPLLRGVASMGFVSPTPIQASVIPVALAGRDVCASAVTGSEFRLL